MPYRLIIICLLLQVPGLQAQDSGNPLNPQLQNLAADFFAWRSKQQPSAGDDIPRVERPADWLPAWSRENLAVYRAMYQDYLQKLEALETGSFSRADEVDALLLSSAIKRVGWELDIVAEPHRNPVFYVQQTLGSVFELLILSSPWTPERSDQLIRLLRHFPITVEQAKVNLNRPVQPFALTAIEMLMPIEEQLLAMQAGLIPEIATAKHASLMEAVSTATDALNDYRLWLQKNIEHMDEDFYIGPDAYQWFLSNVALLPYTASELLGMGQQSWNRAVAFDALQQNRNLDSPELPIFNSANEQIAVAARNELEIRAFLQNQQLTTVPYWLQHYRYRVMPAWLVPLSHLGVTNDLTSASRLDEDAFSYILEPSEDLPYFRMASARDPRPLMIHEGVPGHYFQLAMSWANPDPIRRRYFDSSANEGIGFYVEEMLAQAGLFDFSPRSREIIYSLMRLRALRVEVDIRLAIGDLSIAEAGEYLAKKVPMDTQTAFDEAVFSAFNPGQAIGYQIGKLQIEKFLADARLADTENFSLQAFHDNLMRNGNVPIALQRWEKLGLDDEIKRLRGLASQPATVPY
ncbi:MAG TPA: DUF885 family protein [Xanthomonadales bacterium]|nr:DUF885 family protein [Xanthomonadales bacterium]